MIDHTRTTVVVDDLRKYMASEMRVTRAELVGVDDALMDLGIIDSIELMQLASFVEATYGVQVEDADIVPGNFGSLAAIADYVRRHERR